MEHELRMPIWRIVDEVSSLSPEDRREALDLMFERFCLHCGEDQPARGVCQCNNDE